MNSQEERILKFQAEQERRETLEHRDVLLAIAVILKSREGIQLFNYLFKNFEVTTMPDRGMEGNNLHEYLGFLRAGNSIYKLACEADSEMAASILAKLERDRYAERYEQFRIEHGLNQQDANT